MKIILDDKEADQKYYLLEEGLFKVSCYIHRIDFTDPEEFSCERYEGIVKGRDLKNNVIEVYEKPNPEQDYIITANDLEKTNN